jgi:hypothetical protein
MNPTTLATALDAYAAEAGAVIRLQHDLEPTEPGWSFHNNGKDCDLRMPRRAA